MAGWKWVQAQTKIAIAGAVAPLLPATTRRGVVMWHQGRCGSTVLGELLNQHPDVRWLGEVFHRYQRVNMARPQFARDLRSAQVRAGRRVAGVELKGLSGQQLAVLGVDLDGFIDVAKATGFTACVFLTRRNTLRRIVSVQIMASGLRTTLNMSAGSSEQLRGSLTLPVGPIQVRGQLASLLSITAADGSPATPNHPRYGSLLEMIDTIGRETHEARARVGARYPDVVDLCYEDHIESDPRVAYSMVCEHLGLPNYPAQVTLQRINTRPLREVIANFDAVADLLRGTDHEWMLDDSTSPA